MTRPRTAALALVAVVLATAPAVGADIAFPGGAKAVRVRVEVTDGGKSPELAWAAFLDDFFRHFDRNVDGFLSPAEAKRVFPLPLAGGRQLPADFAAMDADRDGKVTPAEFRAFYRGRGFTPVSVVVRPAAPDDLARGASLFAHLDRDGDGQLSAGELRRAAALLKRLDEDEDEVLTPKELFAIGPKPTAVKAAGLSLVDDGSAPDATLKLALGGKPALASDKPQLRLAADGERPRRRCSTTTRPPRCWPVCSTPPTATATAG